MNKTKRANSDNLQRAVGERCDPAAICDALRAILAPGQLTELRALEAVLQGDRFPVTISGYFNDPEKLAQAVGRIQKAKGIYFVPNPIDPALLARAANRIKKAGKGESTQDTHIVTRRWLLIDLDAIRPTGISSSDVEHEIAISQARAIYSYLRDKGWPDPLSADSGNGAHLLYRIDVPTEDGELVKRCLTALSMRFDDKRVQVDQSVFNPARIFKLYSTLACKGDDTPDRPHRMARVLSVPSDLVPVPVDLLEELAAEVDTSNGGTDEHLHRDHNGESLDLESFIQHHALKVDGPEQWIGMQGNGTRWVFTESPMCDHHEGAAFLLKHASGAISAACHHNSCSWGWRDLRRKLEPVNTTSRKSGDTKVASTLTRQGRSSGILPWQLFPVDALPKPISEFIRAGSKAIGCDPTYLALPTLAALAAAIGNTRRLRLKRSWSEPSILWAAIVGDSGTLKSPALELALSPIRKRQRKAFADYAERMIDYDDQVLQYDRELKVWQRSKAGGNPPEKPEEPIADRYWCDDCTIEALAIMLKRQWRGLLLVRDELAGWLGGFDRYVRGAGGDVARWLEMHGGRDMLVDRKTGNAKTIYVPRAAMSVAGGIQPSVLAKALTPEFFANGLAARLLLACPPRRKKRWSEADVDCATEMAVETVIERLYDLEPESDSDGEPQPVLVGLTPEAKREFAQFYNEHADEHVELNGDLSAAWAKLEGYAARLALVVHLARWAANDTKLCRPDAVDAQSIQAVAKRRSGWTGQMRWLPTLGCNSCQTPTQNLPNRRQRTYHAQHCRSRKQNGPLDVGQTRRVGEAWGPSSKRLSLNRYHRKPRSSSVGASVSRNGSPLKARRKLPH